VGVSLAGAAVAGAIAFTWWPNGDYRPIQPSERGTLMGAVDQIQNVTSGRAALTPERQQQLGGAPTERERVQQPPPSSEKGTGHAGKKSAAADKRSTGSASDQPQTGTTAQPAPEAGGTTTDGTQTTPQATSPQPDSSAPPQDPSAQDPSAPDTSAQDQATTDSQQPPPDGSTQMTPTTPEAP
jgi:hypothetical protein